MVFTDGAYEPDGESHLGSAGLVLIDRVLGIRKVCQVSVPLALCDQAFWGKTNHPLLRDVAYTRVPFSLCR